MKYPMFVVYWEKKTDYDSNISDIENKCNVKISGTEKKKKKYPQLVTINPLKTLLAIT